MHENFVTKTAIKPSKFDSDATTGNQIMLEPVEDLWQKGLYCCELRRTFLHMLALWKAGTFCESGHPSELQRQEGKGFWQRWQRQQVERCVTRTKNLKEHI